MKANKLLLLIIITFLSLQAYTQLKFVNNQMLGIRRTPSYNLDVEGTARFSSWTDFIVDWSGLCSAPTIYPERDWYLQLGKADKRVGAFFVSTIHYNQLYGDSDENLKENVDSLNNPISKIMKVQAYSYNFKSKENQGFSPSVTTANKKRQIGFKAQELEKLFPDLVYKPDSIRNTYAINYIGMIPILTEAIKAQQGQISDLYKTVFIQEREIHDLTRRLENLEMKYEKTKKLKSSNTSLNISDTETEQSIKNQLMQNIPNPFTEDTEIKFLINESVLSARIIIHDLQGAEIKQYKINERGYSGIIIYANELKPGMYMYTLITDGNFIDSKRMVLSSN